MIRNLTTKELSVFPSQEDGKYPENIAGKVFKVSGIDAMYYCQNDRILTWSFPNELYNAVELVVMENLKIDDVTMHEKNIQGMSVDDLTVLRKSFDLQDIIMLRKEGLI